MRQRRDKLDVEIASGKPVETEIPLPNECCGVCHFSHMEERKLVCYGSPPSIYQDENGDLFSARGSIVEPNDLICGLFKPRMHS